MKWWSLAHLDFEPRLLGLRQPFQVPPNRGYPMDYWKKGFPLSWAAEGEAWCWKGKEGMASPVPGEGGEQWPHRAHCAMAWEHGATGISPAPCAWQGQQSPQSLLREGVIYCFQFTVANKSLILFPNLFWKRRQMREAWPWSHQHRGLFPGLDEAPCLGCTGEQMCSVSCSRGRTPATPDSSCSLWHSKRISICSVWSTPRHKCIYYPYKHKIYTYVYGNGFKARFF